ncbi:RNA-binding domain-containing [Pyrrhoderma noxium]|uniref:RNA-binding domain-containing n=1 Tax=Pyrrhoderma noxium TaxID=2282107 RepID=A0A286UND1_9AGAM|nr:RNA-binding domain-containing [Pyrrhoderma noxium]
MSARGRSTSPRPLDNQKGDDGDVDMDSPDKPNAKVFLWEIVKLDLPTFTKSGQNKGKASLEFSTPAAAHKAKSHMDGGQLDGAVLKVELSETPVRSRSRSRFGRGGGRSPSRSRSRGNFTGGRRRGRENRYGDSYRGTGAGGGMYGRRAPVGRDLYRPGSRSWSRSRSRSRSPIRRAPGRIGPRRRSPSYERGGYGRGRDPVREQCLVHVHALARIHLTQGIQEVGAGVLQ